MGIEHRLVDEQQFWRCPECLAVAEADTDIPRDEFQECIECNSKASLSSNRVFWHEFSAYCRTLK